MNDKMILSMLNGLQKYKHSKTELIQFYIQKRLDLNLQQYYRKLQQSVDFLTRKDSKKVLKKLNRVDKK